MLDLLLFSLCVSLACTAIHVAVTWEGMILHWSEEYLQALPTFFRKPLYECLICMCSIWTIFFWTLFVQPVGVKMIFAILVTGGINTIISCFLELASDGKSW